MAGMSNILTVLLEGVYHSSLLEVTTERPWWITEIIRITAITTITTTINQVHPLSVFSLCSQQAPTDFSILYLSGQLQQHIKSGLWLPTVLDCVCVRALSRTLKCMVVSFSDTTIWKMISHVTKNPCPGCSIFMNEEDCILQLNGNCKGNGCSNVKKSSSVQASETIWWLCRHLSH
jgi:hypothetical protein